MSKKQSGTRLKITERALLQRINRKLKSEGEQLRTARSQNVETSVGRYYIVDLERNVIAYQHVDPEALGRKLGAIQPWEELEKGK